MNILNDTSYTSHSVFDLTSCTLCPRECGVDRTKGERGFCGCLNEIRAARAALLYDEEPCISGQCGSGAVFFCGCNLGCIFCQNTELSSLHYDAAESLPGTFVSPEHLASIFLHLQEQGAANINLVTPSPFLGLIIPALKSAKDKGLSIPIVYNTSSYEKVEAIRALDGLVDIYLPDLKFYSKELSLRWTGTDNYWDYATSAIDEMVRQCPDVLFADGSSELNEEDDRDIPLMKRGVIVRHLVMPGQKEDSQKVLRYLYDHYGNQIFYSIMNQYTPMPQCENDPVLSHPVNKKEYDEVVDFAILIGIENGFIQEDKTVSKSFIPSFDGTGL